MHTLRLDMMMVMSMDTGVESSSFGSMAAAAALLAYGHVLNRTYYICAYACKSAIATMYREL